jgi:predicted nucleotidyltransferase
MTTWTPPTREQIESVIKEMVRRIVSGFDPEKIILFGSQARGDAGPDSDVDLLVLMETDSKREAAVRILTALDAMGVPKDAVVITPDEFERRRDIVGTVAYPAHHEGRVLYERPRR